jgi:hypothetical protein
MINVVPLLRNGLVGAVFCGSTTCRRSDERTIQIRSLDATIRL